MSSGLLRPRKRKQLQGAAEKGAVIIIGVFAFVLLLAFAALAIDAGNVYRAQVQLQKAVDLAAIEGPAATVLTARRYDPATLGREPVPDDEVVERMKAVLQHNAVTIGGLTLVNPELPGVRFLRIPASALNPANHAIVEAQVRVTLLLMHVVPFTMFGIRNDSGHSVVLTARAEAQRPSANVALVLDTSDSMRCPSGCACLCQTHAGHPLHKHNCAAEAAGCATATGYQKYQDLQDAVQKFLEFFDEDYDRISLVPYNLAGEVRANIRTKTATPNQGFDRADLFCKLGIRNPKSPDGSTATPNPKCSGGPRADDFMVPALMGSSTNPSSALFHAYADMRTAGIIDTPPSQFDEQAFYILFTDGAPDAGQFLFDAASNNPAVRGSLPPVTVSDFNSDYDYSHYALEWVYAPTAPGGTGGHFPAPGRLVQSSQLHLGGKAVYNNGLIIDGTGSSITANPSCSEDYFPRFCTDASCSNATKTSQIIMPPAAGAFPFNTVFDACLNNFGFRMPFDGSATVYGGNYLAIGGKQWKDYREQYFNVTVAASDYLRQHSGIVYVIGLGPADTSTANLPYQNLDDMLSRKDRFLTRVAADYSRHQADGDFHFEKRSALSGAAGEVLQWSDIAGMRKTQGEYLATRDAQDLTNLFMHMALKIRMRLIR